MNELPYLPNWRDAPERDVRLIRAYLSGSSPTAVAIAENLSPKLVRHILRRWLPRSQWPSARRNRREGLRTVTLHES